jgi:ribosomal-protein-alanine N-acetyltransferase
MTSLFETERLVIRQTIMDDAPYFDRYRNHPDYMRYITSAPNPDYDVIADLTNKLARAAERPQKYWPLSIVRKETKDVIGGLRIFRHEKHPTICEMSYGINPDYWSQGYMSEAAKAGIAWCHDTLKMHRVVIRTDAENVPSWRVAEKIGMVYEGAARFEFKTWRGFIPHMKTYASIRTDLLPEKQPL